MGTHIQRGWGEGGGRKKTRRRGEKGEKTLGQARKKVMRMKLISVCSVFVLDANFSHSSDIVCPQV